MAASEWPRLPACLAQSGAQPRHSVSGAHDRQKHIACAAQVAAAQQAAARQQARALPEAPALGRLGDGQALLERRVHALSARLDATEAAVEQRTDQLAEATEQLQVGLPSGARPALWLLSYVRFGGGRTPLGDAGSCHTPAAALLACARSIH
jgi:hypothetical protein